MISGNDTFTFKPAAFYPFKNLEEIDRVRAITKEDILAMNGRHPSGNPNIRLDVLKNEEFEMVMIADMLKRIIDSDRYDKKVVMIMPNPCTTYRKVAYLLHQLNVNCRNVKFYMMDEWADEDGNVAPLSYKAGFGNAFYSGMDMTLPFEHDYLPIDTERKLTPVMLTIILSLYFQLMTNTMVSETPEVQDMARLLGLKPEEVVDVLKIYQTFDPILKREPLPHSPLNDEAKLVWQRYSNEAPEVLTTTVERLKEYFA